MKVALVHDYIKEYGGAERVLEALHEIWPDAPIYTTIYLPEFLGPHKERFKDWKIVTSWFQSIPLVEKLISPLRIMSPWVFENWNFNEFDAVLVSATGAYFPNLIVRKPGTIHICYCHTPPRYLYGYPTARNWQNNPIGKVVGELVNHSLRQTDFISAQRPDYFIANSHEVRRRIEKFYRRDAEVIYPPVTVGHPELGSGSQLKEIPKRVRNDNNSSKKTYYLTGGRLARPKHIDLAIEACNRLKLPLKIFGKEFAGYGEELRQLAGSTVEFVGEVSDEELLELYKNAKALIYPSEMEDFGIIPVEAQGYGVPVIGFNQGGIKETVINGKTGVLFDELNIESIIAAVRKLSTLRIKREDCIRNAKRFGRERFKYEIRTFVKSKIKDQMSK